MGRWNCCGTSRNHFQALATRIYALALLDGDSELEDDEDGFEGGVPGELSLPVGALGTGVQAAGETGGSVYAGFIRRLNERIDLMNHAVAVRRGMAKAEKEKEKAKEEAAAKPDR